MPTVKEKIAYIRGLVEGSDFSGKDQHAQSIWTRVLEVLDDLADQVEAVRISQEETEEYLEAIDTSLGDVEKELFGDDDDDDDTEYVEVECPECKETVYFEEDFLYDDDVEISCPECGTVLFVSESDDDDDEGDEEVEVRVNGKAGAVHDREVPSESR